MPNTFDVGNFMFSSPIFAKVIPHRFELTQVMRQSDQEFLSAISELRVGKCSAKTQEFFKNKRSKVMRRTFSFEKEMPCCSTEKELMNFLESFSPFRRAMKMKSRSITWHGYHVLQLKRYCKVMLVWNKSDDLKNGSIGIFKDVKNDALLVSFEGVGVVEITRETWIKTNHVGVSVESVCQFPIIPAYAMTRHKSQGLTLPAAVVHCSKEYVPGLLYVAVSRVKSPNHIQVLSFSANQLLPPSHDVLELCSTSNISELSTDLTCCSKQECLDNKCFTVTDRFCDYEDEIDDQLNFPSNMFDGPVISSFEDTDNPDTPLAEQRGNLSAHALKGECVEYTNREIFAGFLNRIVVIGKTCI